MIPTALTAAEVAVLQHARGILYDLAHRRLRGHGGDRHDEWSSGKIETVAEFADDAIFGVLNHLKSHAGHDLGDIHARRTDLPADPPAVLAGTLTVELARDVQSADGRRWYDRGERVQVAVRGDADVRVWRHEQPPVLAAYRELVGSAILSPAPSASPSVEQAARDADATRTEAASS